MANKSKNPRKRLNAKASDPMKQVLGFLLHFGFTPEEIRTAARRKRKAA